MPIKLGKNILTKKDLRSPKIALLILSGGYLVYRGTFELFKKIQRERLDRQWEIVREKKRQQLKQLTQQFKNDHLVHFNLSQALKQEIINSSVSSLKELLFSRKVTIVEVLLTFIERTINYGMPNNWISEVAFEEALEQAIIQDKELLADREVLYKPGNAFFGIPMTIKDQLVMKGYDSSFGTACRLEKLFKPYNFDSNQVYMLKRAGAIIFAKTSMPQLGILMETNNFITGRASSVYSQERSCGGSSGGQGAIIGARCSILGVGTDLGGSIRIPSSFNGIYGYKPSSKRQYLGGSAFLPLTWVGMRNVTGVSGPMGQNVDDLAEICKVFWDPDIYNQAPLPSRGPYYQPIKWNDEEYNLRRKLKIGYFKQSEIMPTSAATHRAIEHAKECLEKQGHELVEVNLDCKIFEEVWRLCWIFIHTDGGYQTQYNALAGEKLIEDLDFSESANITPKFWLKLKCFWANLMGRNRDAIEYNGILKKFSGYDLLEASGIQSKMQATMAELWQAQGLDAMITPVQPAAPYRHRDKSRGSLQIIYTCLWNIFDYGVGVVPVTTIREDEQIYQVNDTYSPGGCKYTKLFQRNMEGSAGLPMCLQIVTLPYKDELCLSIMKQLQETVEFRQQPNMSQVKGHIN